MCFVSSRRVWPTGRHKCLAAQLALHLRSPHSNVARFSHFSIITPVSSLLPPFSFQFSIFFFLCFFSLSLRLSGLDRHRPPHFSQQEPCALLCRYNTTYIGRGALFFLGPLPVVSALYVECGNWGTMNPKKIYPCRPAPKRGLWRRHCPSYR